jgi:hypothetical protein
MGHEPWNTQNTYLKSLNLPTFPLVSTAKLKKGDRCYVIFDDDVDKNTAQMIESGQKEKESVESIYYAEVFQTTKNYVRFNFADASLMNGLDKEVVFHDDFKRCSEEKVYLLHSAGQAEEPRQRLQNNQDNCTKNLRQTALLLKTTDEEKQRNSQYKQNNNEQNEHKQEMKTKNEEIEKLKKEIKQKQEQIKQFEEKKKEKKNDDTERIKRILNATENIQAQLLQRTVHQQPQPHLHQPPHHPPHQPHQPNHHPQPQPYHLPHRPPNQSQFKHPPPHPYQQFPPPPPTNPDPNQPNPNTDVVISGIPLEEGEIPENYVNEIVKYKKINVNVKNDTEWIRRAIKKGTQEEEKTIPKLIIRFKSKEIKDNFMKREKGTIIRVKDICGEETNNNNIIYINEDLPYETRALSYETRQMKKEGFKFVWTKGGIIYLRETESSPIHRINSLTDLTRLKKERKEREDRNKA